ncbi:MAG: hypothetical protein GYA24_03375 [Candidatus Lokiarchaeota archaeon]|nr:hypothetical protein [Candidatus Lokiarchaeota archaeon]
MCGKEVVPGDTTTVGSKCMAFFAKGMNTSKATLDKSLDVLDRAQKEQDAKRKAGKK